MPILDALHLSRSCGLLHVKVVQACKLLKMDILGASDPYKTSIKMKTLDHRWNEDFKLIVKDPKSQVLHYMSMIGKRFKISSFSHKLLHKPK
ncbi:hypothetical protein AAG906_022233 [Vitis piasezkii]